MGASIIRAEGEGEKMWFCGGGIHTWKITSADTAGACFVYEDELVRGKTTPLHTHPDCDEIIYVIEGEMLLHSGGVEQHAGKGAVLLNPRGVEHAFLVLSETARLLAIQTPGSSEAFYRQASMPLDGREEGPVDFRKIGEAAKATGGTVIKGPPPFRR